MDSLPQDLFELVTAATSVSETLPRVVARLKESHEDLELNPATFDFYCKQVMTCPFVHENVVDVALWILGVATHPPDPHDDQSNAIILSLLEIFVKEDSASVCSELVSRGFLPTLKDYVTMKHGKWASRPAIRLMFDICRLNRLSRDQLAFVDKEFLEFLFDLVEQTRYISEELEDYNYSVIRLLLVFVEQFIPKTTPATNPVISLIVQRINTTKTLSENIVFIFNRAEDRSVQMLVLKFLYLIFTIPSTFEWFYTNDLNIVLDVIIRELAATGAEEAALQQGYLRILTPLLLNTRLVSSASFSKLPEIRRLLDSLSAAPEGTIDPTVRRLAQRTAGECEHIWCTAR